mmetsp:Transcript_25751/g.31217  ORF Transcript_25751/g.31217 Transcript_25751/m.31217 type:complete len:236 (+) Transcript_25751:1038-1745(+)
MHLTEAHSELVGAHLHHNILCLLNTELHVGDVIRYRRVVLWHRWSGAFFNQFQAIIVLLSAEDFDVHINGGIIGFPAHFIQAIFTNAIAWTWEGLVVAELGALEAHMVAVDVHSPLVLRQYITVLILVAVLLMHRDLRRLVIVAVYRLRGGFSPWGSGWGLGGNGDGSGGHGLRGVRDGSGGHGFRGRFGARDRDRDRGRGRGTASAQLLDEPILIGAGLGIDAKEGSTCAVTTP